MMRTFKLLAIVLLLLLVVPLSAEEPIGSGGAFVWLNIQSGRAPGEKPQSDEAIRFLGYSLEPPAGEAWRVLHQGPHTRGVGFAKDSPSHPGLIWAASFVLALDSSVDGIVRALVGQPYWQAPQGFKVLTAAGREETRRHTRCVRVSAEARKSPKKGKSKSVIDFRAESLACAHPTAPTLYVVLMFAERKPSGSAWSSSAEDAERFFEGLQFGNLTTPVEQNVVLPGPPLLLQSFDGLLWASLGEQNTLLGVDPATGEVVAEIELPGMPRSMTAGLGSLWVIHSEGRLLARITPGSAEPITHIELPSEGRKVVTGAGAVWTLNGLHQVARIEPEVGSIVTTIDGPWPGKRNKLDPLPAVLAGAVYADPWLWVSDGEHNRVFRIDPQTNQIANEPIKVGRRPRELVATSQSIWAINGLSRSVNGIDRQSGRVFGDVEVHGDPLVGIAHGGSIWISSPRHSCVTRIDTTGQLRADEPIWVGIRPMGLAQHGDYVWVADVHGDILSKVRIGGD